MRESDAEERIRVLRVIGRLNVGGPALHAALLTDGLDPRRYASTLVAGREGPREGDYLALTGRRLPGLVRIDTLGRAIHPLRDAHAFGALVRLMRRVRPHVVHTHTAKAGTLGRLAALVTRVPVVVHTFHGHVFEGYFPPWQARTFVAIERWLARRTDALVTVSASVRAELLAFGIGRPEQLRVVELGLGLDRFLAIDPATRDPGLRRELDLDPDVPLVGIVARLAPIKAHEVFLDAAATLVRNGHAARFVVVGEGERRHELEALATRLGLGDRVRFLGWRADLDRIHAALDVVALTSRNEGSPVALIEALAAGRAVVATRVGGVPDLVRHDETGVLVVRDDAAALATELAALLADATRRARLGAAGRRAVVPRFAAGRLAADVDRLYGDLLAHRAHVPVATTALERDPARSVPRG